MMPFRRLPTSPEVGPEINLLPGDDDAVASLAPLGLERLLLLFPEGWLETVVGIGASPVPLTTEEEDAGPVLGTAP